MSYSFERDDAHEEPAQSTRATSGFDLRIVLGGFALLTVLMLILAGSQHQPPARDRLAPEETARTPEQVPDQTPLQASRENGGDWATPPAPQGKVSEPAAPPLDRARDDHRPRVVFDLAGKPKPSLLQPQEAGDALVSWNSPLGEGWAQASVTVSSLTQVTDTALVNAQAMTRLVAVVFPPDGREVLFVGVAEPNRPPLGLNARQLFDAFVVALRAFANGPRAPGVSFDPTPAQLKAGQKAGDLIPVHYFGGCSGTVVGLATREADRLLKTLSQGEDNESRTAVVCRVAGYQSMLDRRAARGNFLPSRHRFWIEPQTSEIQVDGDGRTFLVNVKLCVKTEQQRVEATGKESHLAATGKPPDRSAQEFVNHLTQYYGEYASEFEVLRQLQAIAQVTSVAKAIIAPEPDAPRLPRPALDLNWLLHGYQPQPVETKDVTPAIVSTKAGVGTITGGVDLNPRNVSRLDPTGLEPLRRAVLDGRSQQPSRRAWEVQVGGEEYKILAQSVASASTPRLGHTDLRVDDLTFGRHFDPRVKDSPFGPGWSVTLPRLVLGPRVPLTDSVTKQTREQSGAALVEEGPRGLTILNRPGTVTVPGEQPADSYGCERPGCFLLHYPNRYVLIDLHGNQQPKFRASGGIDSLQLGPLDRMVSFATEPGQSVSEVRTARGDTKFAYDASRLIALEGSRQTGIRLKYNRDGRCEELAGSDGSQRFFRYDSDSTLRVVTDSTGNALLYHRGRDRQLRVLVLAQSEVRAEQAFAGTVVVQTAQAESAVLSERLRADHGLFVLGRSKVLDPEFCRHKEKVLFQEDANNSSAQALRSAVPPDCKGVVVLHLEEVPEALKRAGADKPVYFATELERVRRNLSAADFGPAVPGHLMILKDGLGRVTLDKLERIPSGSADSRVVVVVCDSNPRNRQELITRASQGEFNGKAIVLVACGGADARAVREAMLDSGARRVWGFGTLVEQKNVPDLIESIQRELHKPSEPDGLQRLRKIIQEAVDSILPTTDDGSAPALIDQIGRILGLSERSVVVLTLARESGET